AGLSRGRFELKKQIKDAGCHKGTGRRQPRRIPLLLEEAEYVQLTALRDMIEASGLRHSRSTDGAELVVQVETRGNRKTDPAADAGIHADILLAADFPGSRVADDA